MPTVQTFVIFHVSSAICKKTKRQRPGNWKSWIRSFCEWCHRSSVRSYFFQLALDPDTKVSITIFFVFFGLFSAITQQSSRIFVCLFPNDPQEDEKKNVSPGKFLCLTALADFFFLNANQKALPYSPFIMFAREMYNVMIILHTITTSTSSGVFCQKYAELWISLLSSTQLWF